MARSQKGPKSAPREPCGDAGLGGVHDKENEAAQIKYSF